MSSRLILASLILFLSMLAGCATQPPGASQSDVGYIEATVTAIDKQQRLVTLQDKDGTETEIEVSDQVKNLDQVEVGDVVRITHTQTLAWQIRKAGEGAPGASVEDTVSVAKPGEKPAGEVGSTETITATITAIDQSKGTVTLTGPEGRSQTIKAANPDNLKKVKVGDLVDISFTESVAIAVVPVKKK